MTFSHNMSIFGPSLCGSLILRSGHRTKTSYFVKNEFSEIFEKKREGCLTTLSTVYEVKLNISKRLDDNKILFSVP